MGFLCGGIGAWGSHSKSQDEIIAKRVVYVRTANVKNVGENGSYWDRKVTVYHWITH